MLTIKEPLVQEEKILSSRFIGVLQPLLGADFKEAKAKIEELYPKATHYCYAYKKGANEGSSDDGEPSHSAGLPILNVLRGSGLDERPPRLGTRRVRHLRRPLLRRDEAGARAADPCLL